MFETDEWNSGHKQESLQNQRRCLEESLTSHVACSGRALVLFVRTFNVAFLYSCFNEQGVVPADFSRGVALETTTKNTSKSKPTKVYIQHKTIMYLQ